MKLFSQQAKYLMDDMAVTALNSVTEVVLMHCNV